MKSSSLLSNIHTNTIVHARCGDDDMMTAGQEEWGDVIGADMIIIQTRSEECDQALTEIEVSCGHKTGVRYHLMAWN